MKYILVTGGVISGIGKGVIASSIGKILKTNGYEVTAIKIDPYINIDAGTFSPYEHGEVFVLDDGGEVDLDLGNYERFMDIKLHRDNNITTGKLYQEVINKERKGDFKGKTVQVIPHITTAIQEWVTTVALKPVAGNKVPEICIIELGGTIGDIEGMPFVEAFRQFQFQAGKENFCCVHVSLVPRPKSTGEHKTKPTQASVRELRSLGLSPDLIVCRSELPMDESVKKKVSNFCHVPPDLVICLPDMKSIYHVPIFLEDQGLLGIFHERLNLPIRRPRRLTVQWRNLAKKVDHLVKEVTISLVGKYTGLEDAYTSVTKSLQHATMHCNLKLNLKFIASSHLELAAKETNPISYFEAWQNLCKSDGVLVPGGFGSTGIEGKIAAIEWARKSQKPFLGICLGFQLAVIEFARNVVGWADAHTMELAEKNKNTMEIVTKDKNKRYVVIEMPEHHTGILGGTMRLGKKTTNFTKSNESVLWQLYGKQSSIEERHRHRYEVDKAYVPDLESAGMRFVAEDESGERLEILELQGHPYFVAVQFHPEYISRPLKPSPPYLGLILASCGKLNSYIAKDCQFSPHDSDIETSDNDEKAVLRTSVEKDVVSRTTKESNLAQQVLKPAIEDNSPVKVRSKVVESRNSDLNQTEIKPESEMKYILVTGGVISGIGKGVIASSIGTILKTNGYEVTAIKIDPYINIDAGTFNPIEHGEVFVLDDGGEVDLDLGNYERFMDIKLHRNNNITTGKIYQEVINKERRGDFIGKTVQVVPHITDAIQEWVEREAEKPVSSEKKPEICIIELGGTIGDIEGMPFVEAFRQFQFRVKRENFCCVHVSLVPQPKSTGEHKTKPTQASVRELRGLGLSPDLIVCRSELPMDDSLKEKVSSFCHVPTEQVICLHDVKSVYHVPLFLEDLGLVDFFHNRLNLPIRCQPRHLTQQWRKLSKKIDNLLKEVTISIVGKYTKLEDAYASVTKALQHATMHCNLKLNLKFIASQDLEPATKDTNPISYFEAWQTLCKSDGVLIPGGFGSKGIEGKIAAIEWARKTNKPLLGICLGFQLAVIEFARNVAGLDDAHTIEITGDINKTNVVIEMPEHHTGILGGTMRLGKKVTNFTKTNESILWQLYGKQSSIEERHRHRYEVDKAYVPDLETAGMMFVGEDESGERLEILELREDLGHPYFVGVQFHPEYISRPLKPSPPYLGLILAACGKLNSYLAKNCQFSPHDSSDLETSEHDEPSENEDPIETVYVTQSATESS